MSDSLAIAAVTQTLSGLLHAEIQSVGDAEIGSFSVKTLPPDKAKPSAEETAGRVNLFLYQVGLSPAWRNTDLPGRTRPGESGHPPLALTLSYLLTAYGPGDSDLVAHRLLGHAMRVLHDHPVLGREELRQEAAWSSLADQAERIRVVPLPLSTEEMTRLWSAFQTPYRLSVAFEVSVVLIESRRPARTPLPVLTRGLGDAGISVQASLVPPFPTLQAVLGPGETAGVRPGERLTLQGHHLDGAAVTIRLTEPRRGTTLDLAPEPGGTAEKRSVLLPAGPPHWPSDWSPGLYLAALEITGGAGTSRSTNALPVQVEPQILSLQPNPVARAADGSASVTVTFRPPVQPYQRVALLLGDLEVAALARTAPAESLTFAVRGIEPGEYHVRLRADGVDSRLIDRSATPPVFDSTAKVTIT